MVIIMGIEEIRVAKKSEIFDNAHLSISSNLARDYFELSGLRFSDINMDNSNKLRQLINVECYKLLEDGSYRMVKDLEVNYKIKQDKWGIYLTAIGSYFKEREAVSFWNPKTNELSIEVGFCGWASGCNRIPFIRGFVRWCDWMIEERDKKHG